MKKIFIVLALLTIFSCTNVEGTTKFLEQNGYTDIEIKGYDFWAKGQDDWSSTRFYAKASNGRTYEGAVTDKGPLCFFRPRWNLRIWKEVE